jgi:hypothetical protein
VLRCAFTHIATKIAPDILILSAEAAIHGQLLFGIGVSDFMSAARPRGSDGNKRSAASHKSTVSCRYRALKFAIWSLLSLPAPLRVAGLSVADGFGLVPAVERTGGGFVVEANLKQPVRARVDVGQGQEGRWPPFPF